MKLLFFISSLSGGGAERVTVNLANHWASKGWRITIVTLAPVTDDCYALHPEIVRRSLSLIGSSRNIVDGLTRNLHRIRALRQVLLATEPDVAVGMMSTACVTLALAGWGLTKIEVIGSVHIHPPSVPTKAVWKWIESIAYGQLSAVVALTQTTATWLIAHTNSRQIRVIPNPVQWPLPVTGPYIEPDDLCRPGRKIILAVGRLVPQKGLDLLISAFATIAERRQDWDLVMLGEGAERQRLQSQITARGMDSRALLPGWAGNLAAWYKRAGLFVMSSRFEGFPNTLVEAMAHGLPAVSFDCDTGPRDIIRNGEDGLLVPPQDLPALTEAVDRLMGDADLRRRLGVKAKETRDRFSMESVAAMWEDLFRDILADRKRRTSDAWLPFVK
ncbi:glycosyltransferase family 4 protein [Methylocapsa sp. D3K7]|uniref:glycosyltransferase family 4 protein n=1 Tax=Methylocapsa sp. D3K7 TaxID=3041435 RepID=UPI00244E9DD2|nr:glycosyltransferase family 4 protein [Methylocapsa sp. D3K7]WGJ16194.1 glycosyltransferase family 4 protein [Methylocapsa sp. D3K7]